MSSRELDFLSDPKEYYNHVGGSTVYAYCTVSAVAIFLWDWLITMEDEINLVWLQDWSLAGKPLYVFLRYGGLGFQLYDLTVWVGLWDKRFCAVYMWARSFGTGALLYLVNILLAYRVVCLYRCNRTLIIINLVALALSAITSVVILGISQPLYEVIATPKYLVGCWASTPGWDAVALASPILFELWIVALVSWRIYLYRKEYKEMPMVEMMKLVVRGHVVWFIIIEGMIVWTILQLVLAPAGFRAIGIPFFRTAICIFGCRLVLDIRAAYFSSHQDDTTCTMVFSESVYDTDATAILSLNTYGAKFGLPPLTKRLQSLWVSTGTTPTGRLPIGHAQTPAGSAYERSQDELWLEPSNVAIELELRGDGRRDLCSAHDLREGAIESLDLA